MQQTGSSIFCELGSFEHEQSLARNEYDVISHGNPLSSLISDQQGVDFRQRTVRDVDHERRPLLHRLHPPPPRHRCRQVSKERIILWS